jgi:hypothetical protein
MTPPIVYATVPRTWDGDTVVVMASGPSLCTDDVESCRGRARVIAVKDAIRLAPFADGLYGCDANFWYGSKGFPTFAGFKYSIDPIAARYGPQLLKNTGESGLEVDPTGLRTGKNSTYQAVNLAVHLGARRILLLGVDMGHSPYSPKYFYGDRPKGQRNSPWAAMLLLWPTLLAPLQALGIEIINCSRQTAIDCFPRRTLQEALA